MFTIPNQSSIPKAYTQFANEGEVDDTRLMASSYRDRLVDCMEEFVRYTIVMRPHFDLFSDRYSEREERRSKQELTRKLKIINVGQTDKVNDDNKVNGVNLDKI